MLYLMELSQRCTAVGFSTIDQVTCGEGVNIYFGNFSWDSPKRLSILLDVIATYSAIAQRVALSPINRRALERKIAGLRRDFVYLVMRKTLKERRIPPEALRLAENGALTALVYAGRAAELAVLKAMGRYQPQ
jgi:succinoglycan biosynthesis protein ExoW